MRPHHQLGLLSLALLLTSCADLAEVAPTPPEPTAESVLAPSPEPPATPNTVPNPSEPTSTPNAIDLPCMETSHGCIALNPDVTDDTLAQTICVTGYTATIRPSTSYTNGIKRRLLREQGIDESHISDYELDHLIPLAVGGHPRKLSNLQLQPWTGENSATEKDGLERRLQHKVCNGEINLVDAQYCIAEDWRICQTDIAAGRIPSGGRVITADQTAAH